MEPEEINKEIDSAAAFGLWERQQISWPAVRERYKALERVQSRYFHIDGCTVGVQFNPDRIRSSAARTDARSLAERPCFLCDAQIPSEQEQMPFGEKYWLMVNPYPIFPCHFTLPVRTHEPQQIAGRYVDMLEMARRLDRFVLFYNGPRCGASAPDHAHFQAGSKGFLPIEKEWRSLAEPVATGRGSVRVYAFRGAGRHAFIWESDTPEAASFFFERLYGWLEVKPGDGEPMLNLLVWTEDNKWITCLFPRSRHRPSCYFASGPEHLLLSPASVDMGGVLILPAEEDFMKIKEADIRRMFGEVCLAQDTFDFYLERLWKNDKI